MLLALLKRYLEKLRNSELTPFCMRSNIISQLVDLALSALLHTGMRATYLLLHFVGCRCVTPSGVEEACQHVARVAQELPREASKLRADAVLHAQ